MSDLTVEGVRAALVEAGFEVYRVESQSVLVAERIRMHLMDSGVRVELGESTQVAFAVRSQRSDRPQASPDELFESTQAAVDEVMRAKGFNERARQTSEKRNPVDDSDVLDVWYELVFARTCADLREVVDAVRWARDQPKCVSS